MIFSSTMAGVDQSMRRNTRKPRLNHEENRCAKSASTAARSSRCTMASINCSRIATSAAVPPGRKIEPAEQLLPARLGGGMQLRGGLLRAFARPRIDRRIDALAVGPEAHRERLEERDARPGGELGVACEDLARERDPRGLAASRQQFLAQLDQRLGARGRLAAAVAGAVDERAAALGDRLQQLAEERGVHAKVLGAGCGGWSHGGSRPRTFPVGRPLGDQV